MLGLLATVLALSSLLLFRNELVYRAHMRRIDEVFASDSWPKLLREFNEHSYDWQVLDLRLWTYRQFFPEAA
jgi:hypothetical protein